MTEEYELSTYDRHELNYNQIALGRLPMSRMWEKGFGRKKSSLPFFGAKKQEDFRGRNINGEEEGGGTRSVRLQIRGTMVGHRGLMV
ncbi:hypothetical protein Ccrd_013488 [Cynara cardunculus var. scolymus]|uniref:Uncharacterized protein n=1 Tax=Cynara cardunculus var. scolymus TaxID=59895 RepID=A0A118K4W2_CYNCS|nr:hypothetical protein Ccrd_013488 [Cynara cardunculus var. scolymus]